MTDQGPVAPHRPCIFVSAVSGELEQARAIAAHTLRVFHNVDVVFQQELGTEGGEVLAMLRHLIDKCDGVLQLIGDAYGAAPLAHVEGFAEVSYTQFEFLYALERRKLTWLIRVEGTASRNPYVTEPVGPGKYGRLAGDLLALYERRLVDTAADTEVMAAPEDPPALHAVLNEHRRRRQLQRQYAARLADHLEHVVRDDDDLVRTIRDLRSIPPTVRRPGRMVGLDPSLHENFVGRAALTADILTALNPFDPRQASSRRIVLHGLGGNGKTALATQIGHMQNALGRDVLLIRTTAGEKLDDSLARLTEPFGLGTANHAGVVREWLREHRDWLLIIDGVDDRESAELVHQFCDEFQGGHFLITSCFRGYWKSAGPAQHFHCYDVEMLGVEPAHRLLRMLLDPERRDHEHDTRALAALLGGHPLAIRHASGFLNNNLADAIAEYIAVLESTHMLPDAGEDYARPPRAVDVTWQANLARVTPGARTLLRLLAFLTDHPLPTQLLKSPDVERAFQAACLADPFENGRTIPSALWTAARDLDAYSLLRLGRSSFVVHRLVLRMTQGSLRPAAVDMLPAGLAFQEALARNVDAGVSNAPRVFLRHVVRLITDYLEVTGRVGWVPLYPHVQRLISLYLEDSRSADAAFLLAADELLFLTEALSLGGHYDESLDHCERAAAADAVSPVLAARAHTQLAWEYFNQDRFPLALEHYAAAEQALERPVADSRYDETRYYLYSGRGWLYRYLGRVEEGLADYQRAAALAEGRGYPQERADAAMGLGGVYEYAGDAEAAGAAYADAIRFADSARDPWLQAVARYMFGYFRVNQQSRVPGIALCQEAMAIGERYGFTDIVEESAWILAVGFVLEGELATALRMAERAIESPSPMLEAWDHLVRGIVRFRIGDISGARSDFETSFNNAEESVARFECFEHLHTAAFAHTGMTLTGEENHRSRAISAFQRARAIAPAKGIRDMGLVVLSCFGSDPAVARLRDQMLRAAE